MIQKKNKLIKCLLILVVALIGVLLLSIVGIAAINAIPTDYETTDIGEYGNYVGVAEKVQDEYMGRFFPEAILPEFENVQYQFRSRTVDTYGFEVYLEFTFQDADDFEAFIQNNTEGMRKGQFYFNDSYQEYVLVNEDTGNVYDSILLSDDSYTDEDGTIQYYINYANIAKVLANPSELQVIYIVVAVFDGGGTDTGFLNSFFSRFNIDPKEYEQHTGK